MGVCECVRWDWVSLTVRMCRCVSGYGLVCVHQGVPCHPSPHLCHNSQCVCLVSGWYTVVSQYQFVCLRVIQHTHPCLPVFPYAASYLLKLQTRQLVISVVVGVTSIDRYDEIPFKTWFKMLFKIPFKALFKISVFCKKLRIGVSPPVS